MNKVKKTAVFLINLGTPDSPSVPDVRKYLREFLMDRRVIDIPFLNRWFLVNLIIAPFRAPKSAKVYREVWTDKGSPLLVYGLEAQKLLQERLDDNFQVFFGMRYQNPSIEKAVKEMEGKGFERIVILPLFPQYASATTGSAVEKAMEYINKWEVIPEIRIVANFPNNPLFIKAFTELGKKYIQQEQYDHFVFTYHGIPERQIKKAAVQNYCQLNDKCCSKYHNKNYYCYRAQCYETTRHLVKELGLAEGTYSVAFQSRLGKTPWIRPYTDDLIRELAEKGVKRILAFSPSFVADCLETTIEVGEEYKELFIEHGGEHLQLVESLNNHPMWIECMEHLILNS